MTVKKRYIEREGHWGNESVKEMEREREREKETEGKRDRRVLMDCKECKN